MKLPALLLLLSLPTFAQSVYTDAETALPNQTYGASTSATSADFDLDGDADIIVAIAGGNDLLLTNNGSAMFSFLPGVQFSQQALDTREVLAAGLNSDAYPDLISAAGQDSLVQVFINDKTGFLVLTASIQVFSEATSLVTEDFNSDGFIDIFVGTSGQDQLFLNDGTGTFSNQTAFVLPVSAQGTNDAAAIDANGDGHPDLLLATNDRTKLLMNNGSGVFSDESGNLPQTLVVESARIESGDIDSDGDEDILLGNISTIPGKNPQDRIYLNDGSGIFADVTTSMFIPDGSQTTAILMGDFNNDGAIDILNGSDPAGLSLLVQRDGVMINETADFFPAGTVFIPGSFLTDDFDGDGLKDVYACNFSGQDHLFMGTGFSSVSELKRQVLSIYPNPVQGDFISINFPGTSAGALKVFDQAGRMVLSETASPGNQNIRISGLRPGVYSITIEGETVISSGKILIL